MPYRYETPHSHLTTYHGNNAIIMQFIFFEVINAFQEVYELEYLVSQIKLTPTKKFSKSDREHMASITTSISRLAGYTQKYMRIFTWNLNDGILAKLKNYCSYFANNISPDDPDVSALQRNAERAWINCLECIDQIREAEKLPTRGTPDLPSLKTYMEKMVQRLRRLSRVAGNIVLRFKEDENVLLFLLNHQDQLDRLYEDQFVAKLFHKMFPKGLQQAEEFLVEQYASRGFDHLLPQITSKFATLEAIPA